MVVAGVPAEALKFEDSVACCDVDDLDCTGEQVLVLEAFHPPGKACPVRRQDSDESTVGGSTGLNDVRSKRSDSLSGDPSWKQMLVAATT